MPPIPIIPQDDDARFAWVEHDDGSTTKIYRAADDAGVPVGHVKAVVNPDADETKLLTFKSMDWMDYEVVFMNASDFDLMSAGNHPLVERRYVDKK